VFELAAEAGIEEPDRFAAQWHILMKGSIVAAHEAAPKAQKLGLPLLARHGVADVA